MADLVQQGARVGSPPCEPPGEQMRHQRQRVQDAQRAAAQQRLAAAQSAAARPASEPFRR
ncbi:hypothetical protein HS99_0027580 [Kitasatospora aureofaciens]|uniref:Uncharacterized protein n=1 Tax=Kitasatospora aureofaciens TaxID=1894 RepID=A0A1E7N7U2_KITAU|nr:hypothetical protein HS99_0027580 [Kitasatospora aureofaciens]